MAESMSQGGSPVTGHLKWGMTESMAESMTEGRFPEPEPEYPYLDPDGRDLRPENEAPSKLSGFRSPLA